MKDTPKTGNFPNLICLIGIDGSGKTTLAKSVVEEAKKLGIKYKYVWGNARPIFLKPLRFIAHLTVLRKFDRFKDNNQYEKAKEEVLYRFGILSRIYSSIYLIDYIVWLFLKVKVPLFFGKKIICDRYIFDVAINLYFLNKKQFGDIKTIIQFLFKYFPQPELLYLVDVPSKVAFERKTDVPSVDFLEKRRGIYQRLSEIYNARKLDGTMSIKDLTNIILSDICKGVD